MAFERKWAAVPPQAFTADGNTFGFVTVADTAGFKVKQSAYLVDSSNNKLVVQIKKVLSSTKLVVGLVDQKLSSWKPLNISTWTVVSGAAIGAEEQDKNNIPGDDHYKAIYEADPTVADRVVLVDQYGDIYSDTNPLPATFSGSISIGSVSIIDSGGDELNINPDGSINVVVESAAAAGVVVSKFNEVVAIASGATTQLVSYTVPAGKHAFLQRSAVSGENIGKYDLLINAVVQDTVRTMFGGDLTGMFDFTSGNDSGLLLNPGDIVKVQVFNPRPYIGTFNARIQVLEVTP